MKREERKKGDGSSSGGHLPPNPPCKFTFPDPINVALQPNPSDERRETEEKQFQRDQLKEAIKLNKINRILVGVTGAGIIVSMIGVVASLYYSRKTLQVTERPWLSPSASITEFDWNGPPDNTTLIFRYAITVENTGNLPATNVFVFYDDTPIVPRVGKGTFESVMKEVDDFCDSRIRGDNFVEVSHRGPATIFPKRQFTFDDQGFDKRQSSALWKQEGFDTYLRGCVIYTSPTIEGIQRIGFFFEPLRCKPESGMVQQVPQLGDTARDICLKDYSAGTKSD